MQGPEEGEKEGRKRSPGKTEKKGKQEDRVQGMENGIHEMEGTGDAWTGAKEGDIQHVGEPQDREVHGCRPREREGLAEGLPGEARGDKRVVQDVGAVVKGDEPVPAGGEEEEERDKKGEEGANRGECAAAGNRPRRGRAGARRGWCGGWHVAWRYGTTGEGRKAPNEDGALAKSGCVQPHVDCNTGHS